MPSKFKKLLGVSNKISQVILLGNCTKSYEFLKFVNEVSSNVVIVRGEYDNGLLPVSKHSRARESIPINTVVRQGAFKIGCCSGYTVVPKNDPLSLLALARQLDVDILLWGGTHNVEAFTLEGKFFVNPGSCTGAFNTDWPFSTEDEDKQDETEGMQNQDEETDQTAEIGQQQEKEEKDQKNMQDQNQDQNQENQTHEKGNDEEINRDQGQNKSEEEGKEPVEDDLELSELDIDGSNTPSFCLLDIQSSTCTLYIYIYIDGEVKVDKVVYQKED